MITGIKRIYKNSATVNEPDSADTETNGLWRNKGTSDVTQVDEIDVKETNRARGAASAQIRASIEGVCSQ